MSSYNIYDAKVVIKDKKIQQISKRKHKLSQECLYSQKLNDL